MSWAPPAPEGYEMDTSSASEMNCQYGFNNAGYGFAERHFEAKLQKIFSKLAAEPAHRVNYGRFRQIASFFGFGKSD